MKEFVKHTIRTLLYQNPHMFYTARELRPLLPANTPESTIARALRKLWEEDYAARRRDPRHYKFRQYSAGKKHLPVQLPLPVTTPSNVIVAQFGGIPMDLQTAVTTVVNAFVTAGKTFSAHDVTEEVRRQVNAGTLTVDPAGVGSTHVSGKPVPRIEHTTVRDFVHQLWTAGQLGAYTRTNNGKYYEYQPAVPAVSADPDDAATPDVSDAAPYDGSSTV